MATDHATKTTNDAAPRVHTSASSEKRDTPLKKTRPTSPKKSQDKSSNGSADNKKPFSDREVKLESSKVARKAQIAQKEAIKYREAAYGAGDPDERQKLLEQAINKQIEAESFGKTAKYLRSGTFQGMIVGTGLGMVPGITLGTVVGMLVGGLVCLITGGLGAGVGALTGWLHGPFWDVGKLIGGTIRKITGDLPGWKATNKQKKKLEAMLGQIKDEDMPDADELEYLRQDDGSDLYHSSWARTAYSAETYVPKWMRVWDAEQAKTNGASKLPPNAAASQKAANDLARHAQGTTSQRWPTDAPRKKPRKLEVRSSTKAATNSTTEPTSKPSRKAPRKLENRA